MEKGYCGRPEQADEEGYLTTRIEAEVRKQKGEAALALSVPVFGELVSTVETTVEETEE